MPLIKPKSGMSKEDFMEMCMSDPMMMDEFNDEDQRYKVCMAQWDKGQDSASKKHLIESRSYPLEVRLDTGEDNITKIVGYAAVYEQLSGDLGGFKEKIKRGFFKLAIERDDVRALFNHDSNMVLGRTKNNTLKLEEDRHGLKVEIIPPDTSYARDLTNLIRRGDVDQMSFQWITEKDEWDSTDMNNVIRTLVSIKELWDVSPVTFAAYPQTKAEVNSAREVYKNYLEEVLEDISRQEKDSKDKKDREGYERISVMRKRLMIMEKEI